MKKALSVLAALGICVMIALSAAANANDARAEGLMNPEPVEGIVMWPEGASAPQATFLISYAYPQIAAETQADEAINRYYQDLAADMRAVAQQQAESGEEMRMEITCDITHQSKRYLSIAQTMVTSGGNGEYESLSADTFARDGVYAGQPLTLSQVLGLEQEDSLSTAHSVAERLAYDLVWQIVERDLQNTDSDYLDGMTKQELERSFLPETDFYLDEDGNVVFFIQAGEIAGEIAGILRFPFAPAELMSAL